MQCILGILEAHTYLCYKQLTGSYSRKTTLQGGLVMAKVEDWKWQTIFYGHYRSNFNHCNVFGQQSNRIPWKNAKSGLLRRSRSWRSVSMESPYTTTY